MSNDKIKILQLPLGPMQTNAYLFACLQTKTAAVIDPSWDGKLIVKKAQQEGWQISHIMLTHSHFDHVAGLAEVKDLTQAPIYIHPEAEQMLENAVLAANLWQITIPTPPPADKFLEDQQILNVGELQLEVLFTPGHAPGHVCFYLAEHDVLFDGDVLFQQSIGRTDLPGGNHQQLIDNIKKRVLVLPDQTVVLSGHGPVTTIGREKQWNPYLT